MNEQEAADRLEAGKRFSMWDAGRNPPDVRKASHIRGVPPRLAADRRCRKRTMLIEEGKIWPHTPCPCQRCVRHRQRRADYLRCQEIVRNNPPRPYG